MKKLTLLTLTFLFCVFNLINAQTKTDESSTVPVWTAADRKYLVDNLIRSKDELLVETKTSPKRNGILKKVRTGGASTKLLNTFAFGK